MDPTLVTLKPLESGAAGVQLFEARAPTDHWHRYVVAQRGDGTWRLGGFAATDLPDFYNSIRDETRTEPQRDSLGRYLVRLSDPYGSEILFPGNEPVTHAAARAWTEQRPRNWPADTVHAFADCTRLIRITALSKHVNSYDQPWIPAVYTFVFDAEGDLRTWHRRENPVLQLRGA